MNDRRRQDTIPRPGTAPDGPYAELLQSIADVARAMFGAGAASIMLHDAETDEFVFAASSGEGADWLAGARFRAAEGFAGSALASGEVVVVDDPARDPRFAADVAQGTGYVPNGIIAAPLRRGGRTLGVIEVLDRPEGERFGPLERELLEIFATQAAIGLDLASGVLARTAVAIERLDPARRTAALQLVAGLDELLSLR